MFEKPIDWPDPIEKILHMKVVIVIVGSSPD
jgi:hypothetical protein